jgi:spermidine synthase
MNCRIFAALATILVLVHGLVARADTKVVYKKASAYNTILVTEGPPGIRTLRFQEGGARQSVVKLGDPAHLELPYAQTALAGLAFCDKPRRVLVVGLGGGTIPMFLRKYYPGLWIDAVEIDPDVVDVAKRYFGFVEDAKMRAHVADGRRFIEQCRQPYDVIFLDAFGCDNVPFHLATQEFLVAVRRATAPNGVVVGNIWSRGSNPLHDSMIRTYQEVFDELYILGVPLAGNEILLAPARKRQMDCNELARRAAAISQEKGFPFDLGKKVTHDFQYAADRIFSGEVLKDAEAPAKQHDFQ